MHRKYSTTIQRPFAVRYEPVTCSVDVLDEPSKIQTVLCETRDHLKILQDALEKLGSS